MTEKNTIQILTLLALIGLVIGGIGPYFGFFSDIVQALICIIAFPVFIMGILFLCKYRDGEEDYPFMGY